MRDQYSGAAWGKIECPRCKGAGREAASGGWAPPCSDCNGQGKILVWDLALYHRAKAEGKLREDYMR